MPATLGSSPSAIRQIIRMSTSSPPVLLLRLLRLLRPRHRTGLKRMIPPSSTAALGLRIFSQAIVAAAPFGRRRQARARPLRSAGRRSTGSAIATDRPESSVSTSTERDYEHRHLRFLDPSANRDLPKNRTADRNPNT